jgi:capsular polysaccharide transport system permease protein
LTDSAAPELRSIHRQLRFATPRVVTALILREMASTHGRKPGGYFWAVMEPVAGIALLSWIFTSIGFRSPSLGTNFAIFYATGLLPFYVFTGVSQKLTQALVYSRSLLAYPRVTVVDVLLARFLLALLTQLLVACVVLTGLRLMVDTGTQLLLGHIVLGFAMAAALAAGVGVANCFLITRFPLWSTAWSVMTRPLVLVSGVILTLEKIPTEYWHWFLWNPIVHVVAEVRTGFYHGYEPTYISPLYVFGVSLALAVVGFLFLWRYHRDVLED